MTRRIRYDVWSPGGARSWTSPWCEPGFAFTELVASWSATTPRGTCVGGAARARGIHTWHELGRWTSGARRQPRTSITSYPEVDTDVWRPGGKVHSYRLRV